MIEQQPTLLTETFTTPKPPGDSVTSFEQVLHHYSGGRLQVPPHQRDANAWDARKRKEYIARLRQAERGSHPPGFFATYQLVAEHQPPSLTYLNDGFQRLTTLQELRSDPELFGLDASGVELLLQQEISVQHRHYATHEEAMGDFQKINNGTHLTPYELCQGYLKYMPGYEPRWRQLLEAVDQTLRDSEIRLGIKTRQTKNGREQEHVRRRHTLSLFHRFLTDDKAHSYYPDVSAKDVQVYIDKQEVTELRLRDALLDAGSDAQQQLKLFQAFIVNETAWLEEKVRKVLGAGVSLAPVTHRWVLDLAVWRRNNQKPRDAYDEFISVLLKRTGGRGQWLEEHGKPVTLRFAQLGLLPHLTDLAGMPEFCERLRRQGQRPVLKPGFDHSHMLSFATNGDGPTFPEPAVTNRARGARPVEET